mmetsp:Transcript_7926/g.14021  ORF Transcript_7926/g.14021 Transcript_7926/m.14021 type:complete len:467 (+) Transcript_7926:163-1563(+)
MARDEDIEKKNKEDKEPDFDWSKVVAADEEPIAKAHIEAVAVDDYDEKASDVILTAEAVPVDRTSSPRGWILTRTGAILYLGACFFLSAVAVAAIVCGCGVCSRSDQQAVDPMISTLPPTTTTTTPTTTTTSAATNNGDSPISTPSPQDVDAALVPPSACQNSPTCYDNADDLQAAFLDPETTLIALCADIQIQEPLKLDRTGVRLVGCCRDGNQNWKKCVIQGSGQGRNLIVTGDDFVMENIALWDGYGQSNYSPLQDACGGNLLIDGPVNGRYQITQCEFFNGQCSLSPEGGNVYVSSPGGSVTCIRSKFVQGLASFGGGLAVVDATAVRIEGCEFTDNQGSGLAHFIWSPSPDITDPGQQIVIRDSTFTNNEGRFGGAIFGSNFGAMPKLEVWTSHFEGNRCTGTGGGSASTIASTGPVDLTWNSNTGNSDSSDSQCQQVYFSGYGEQFCFATSDSFQSPQQP